MARLAMTDASLHPSFRRGVYNPGVATPAITVAYKLDANKMAGLERHNYCYK